MPKPTHNKDAFFKYYTARSAALTLSNGTRKWSTPIEFNDPFDNQFDLIFENPSDSIAKATHDAFQKIISSTEPLKPNQFGERTPVVQLIREILRANPTFQYTPDELAYIQEGSFERMQRVIAIQAEVSAGIREILSDTTIPTNYVDNLLNNSISIA